MLVTEDGTTKLDPVQYVSVPQLFWNVMLEQTRPKLERITDVEIYGILANSMRCDISMIISRNSKANNKDMGSLFDPTKPSIYSINLDNNNLDGKEMTFPMPQSGFTWP